MTEILKEPLEGPGPWVKLVCDEHRNRAPLSSLVTE